MSRKFLSIAVMWLLKLTAWTISWTSLKQLSKSLHALHVHVRSHGHVLGFNTFFNFISSCRAFCEAIDIKSNCSTTNFSIDLSCFISTRLLLVTGSCPSEEESLIVQNANTNPNYWYKYQQNCKCLWNLQMNMRKSADRDSNAVHHDFMLSNPKLKNTS